MFVVCATFTIEPGCMDEFMPLMNRNARTSLDVEEGCHRFDVCVSLDDPDEVFLYELYSDRGDFDLHLQSDHFLEFDRQAAPMVREKVVKLFKMEPTD